MADVSGCWVSVERFRTVGAGISKDLAEHVAFCVEAVKDGQLATGKVVTDVMGLGAVKDDGAMSLGDDGARVDLAELRHGFCSGVGQDAAAVWATDDAIFHDPAGKAVGAGLHGDLMHLLLDLGGEACLLLGDRDG